MKELYLPSVCPTGRQATIKEYNEPEQPHIAATLKVGKILLYLSHDDIAAAREWFAPPIKVDDDVGIEGYTPPLPPKYRRLEKEHRQYLEEFDPTKEVDAAAKILTVESELERRLDKRVDEVIGFVNDANRKTAEDSARIDRLGNMHRVDSMAVARQFEFIAEKQGAKLKEMRNELEIRLDSAHEDRIRIRRRLSMLEREYGAASKLEAACASVETLMVRVKALEAMLTDDGK